jgi:hypothetical protein
MAAPPLAAVLLGVLALVAFPAAAEIRETVIRADPRTIIPLDEFGFSHQGILELNISGIAFDPPASSDLRQKVAPPPSGRGTCSLLGAR